MTVVETRKKFETLFEDFNQKLIDLNIESKHLFHGNIKLEITDLNHPNKYHPEASCRLWKTLPDIEDKGDFLDKMFTGRKNDE